MYDSKNWVHYLTRPFNLFGASLWHRWYFSKQTREMFGTDMPDVLFVEEREGVVRHYRRPEQLDHFRQALWQIVLERPKYCLASLQKGAVLNQQGEKSLLTGSEAFSGLQEAVDFLTAIGIYATTLPFFTLVYLEESQREDKKLFLPAEQLRKISYYSKILENIVEPWARKALAAQGIDDHHALNILTIQDITRGASDIFHDRKTEQPSHARFIYQSLNGTEDVTWTTDPYLYIRNLEHTSEDMENGAILKGTTAFAGKARGVARVVLNADGQGIHFDAGDILVSINSNPRLMPLILKAGAIVTDEGGVSCHAAIISRELKKPCVMGTRKATQVLKDGDIIEVDADEGIVRIIAKM